MRTAVTFGVFALSAFTAMLVALTAAPVWLLAVAFGLFLLGVAMDDEPGEGI